MSSPTQRSLQFCKQRGMVAGVVERWIPQAGVRKDLFGCIDLIVLVPGAGVLGVQATSGSNHSSRVAKAKALPELAEWLSAGAWFEVWSWAKRGPRGRRKVWALRRTPIRLEDL